MTEWLVDIQSMVPNGEIGERMVVAQVNERAGTYALMHTPVLTTHDRGESFGNDEIFMRAGWSTSTFGKNEIDQFLQAMMDAGWKRGLRPAGFDPSAGELAAVNRHLEDMRKIAEQTAMRRVELSDAAREQLSQLGAVQGPTSADIDKPTMIPMKW